MSRRRRTRTLAGAALVLGLVAGCRRQDDGSTVVEFWAMGREGEVVQRMVPAFEQRTPGVRVRVQQIPWSAAHEKLLTAYVGEAMPDVVQVGNTWIPELQALDALEPLDPWIARSSRVRTDAYPPGVLEPNAVAGRIYGLPWYVDTRVLFYRSDLLAAAGRPQPPSTWDEWIDAMARVKARAGAEGYAILLPMTEWQVPVILALQRGATLLRDGDRYGDFQSAPFREAFALYVDLFGRGLAPRAGEAQVANLYQEFARGTFAFYVSGPWNLGEFSRRLPAELADRWSTAPMPGPERGPGDSLAGGASLAVVRTSSRKDAAWRWVEYLSEPEQQIEFHRLTGDLPARTAGWDDPALRADVHARAFWIQLQHLRSTPKIPEWERIAAKIGEHAESAIRGDTSVAATLAALDADVDTILEKRRWMLARGAAAPDAGAAAGAGAAGPR